MAENNQAQAEYWSSASGLKWIELEDSLDQALVGSLEAMLGRAALRPAEVVLDVGCGTGASTLAAATRLPRGRVLGNDISPPLLERARQRARDRGANNADFMLADAQVAGFDGWQFDVLVSRFGMSFFADSVAALANLGRRLRAGGRMVFVCWAPSALNPWFEIPGQAAVARLGEVPGSDPTAPGPLAFQDSERVTGLMRAAGLVEVEADVVEVLVTPPGGMHGAARTASRVGPAARVMASFRGTEDDAHAIEEQVAREFAAFEQDGEVQIPAQVILYEARAPG